MPDAPPASQVKFTDAPDLSVIRTKLEKLPNLRLLKSLLKCAAVSLIQTLWVRAMMRIAAFTALFFLADVGTTVAGERDNARCSVRVCATAAGMSTTGGTYDGDGVNRAIGVGEDSLQPTFTSLQEAQRAAQLALQRPECTHIDVVLCNTSVHTLHEPVVFTAADANTTWRGER
jgi:hypothetical protein